MSPAASGRTAPSADVLVVVPARDEAERIAACLTTVVGALEHAAQTGVVGRVRVGLGAHRCGDGTGAIARTLLADLGVDHVVVDDAGSRTVGEVRHRLVGQAMQAEPHLDPDRTWVLSTDADTVVPRDWVTGLLGVAADTGADLVAGFVDLDAAWDAAPAVRQAYRRLLEAGADGDGHTHVWAANLAVRYAAYQRAGGFGFVPHGEERTLLERVSALGTVVGSLSPRVSTSARTPGRARDGLADLLSRLQREHAPAPVEWPGAGTATA